MARKTRAALKGQFQNGSIPTAQHFGDLIDSALNKQDDQFYGYWQPGVAHRVNDVVIYCDSMYVLYKTDNNEPSYCHTAAPVDDKSHWRQLQFTLQDKDWVIPEAETETYIYAHPERAQRVGIGHNRAPKNGPNVPTDQPDAQLHIIEKDRGEFLFNPVPNPGVKDNPDMPVATLQMRTFNGKNPQQEPCFTLQLNDNWLDAAVNTEQGYRFRILDAAKQSTDPLLVMGLENNRPAVGIGTETPEAALHIKLPAVGELHINPAGSPSPAIKLTNLGANEQNAFLNLTVNHEFAEFDTTSEKGFQFLSKSHHHPANGTKSPKGEMVVVTPHGQLSIGSETPDATTRLHVTDQDCGIYKVGFDGYRPTTVLTQLDNGADKGSLVLGVDTPVAVLATNAACGFVFRHTPDGKNPQDIHQADDQVWIDEKGQLGIGQAPVLHELDIKGAVRQYEHYMASTEDKIVPKGLIDGKSALEIVNCLNPIVFTWESAFGNINTDHNHYGLNQDECKKFVPNIVKKDEKDTVIGLNYIELIPILISAIKEQQAIINDLLKK